jgi:peptidoglycan hydrolase CwlO-like protein
VGLIAEEVDAVDTALTTKDDGVTPSNINWVALQTYMLKEMQKMQNNLSVSQNNISFLQNNISVLQNKNDDLNNKISVLENTIKTYLNQ